MFKGKFFGYRRTLPALGLVAVFFLLMSVSSPVKEEIRWISFEQLQAEYAKSPKPVLIDLYTDWCGWCKQMDRTTYRNENLAAYVNKNYYAVKYNAESAMPVKFNGKVFKYNDAYRTNELAIYLSGGQLSYPTTVFMSGTDAQPAPLPGYMKPKQMEAPLKFFGERANERGTFIEFNKKMKPEWRD